jgi:hypothetical protein
VLKRASERTAPKSVLGCKRIGDLHGYRASDQRAQPSVSRLGLVERVGSRRRLPGSHETFG